MNILRKAAKKIDQASLLAAQQYQSTLTKPIGSLGTLETLAEKFAGWQGTAHPTLSKINVVIFAADHGVCQQQVSAFPQAVTTQMIVNFLSGGAAISVLSQRLDADFSVCNMGTVTEVPEAYCNHPKLQQYRIAQGTADFSQQAAMTETELQTAIQVGYNTADALDTQLFIGGEMGIGNTTSASAIYAALLDLLPDAVVGAGTGVNKAGIQRKQQVIAAALALHQAQLDDPYHVLRCLGGLEIAALVGCYIRCAQKGIPVLVDGVICSAAALLAIKINASVQNWFLFSHQSTEPAHQLALCALQEKPLLDLAMRLGEGSGAAVAVPLLQMALALHNGMATFSQAGVSDGDE
jgi:nicotinate-nucleotide--dimethylbenzimidazole phosphoribosyltransferase